MNCVEPGCTGTYDEDGYCNFCGSRAPAGVVASSSPPSSGSASSLPSVPSTQTSPSLPTAQTGSQPTGTRRTAIHHSRLGAGLVTIAPVTVEDPAARVLRDPQIPEEKRFCMKDGLPVGRGNDGGPGRTEGFCRQCRTPFSFRPKLRDGDLVVQQYDVAGCIAHGGLGWIYLARDRNVDDKWVVLKGMMHSSDPDTIEAAQAELRFLAAVDHPNIVKILNFVQHDGDGYIVMEYVGGSSLRDLLKEQRPDPLPIEHALAYALEILPALGYLHERGLLYCDFKPDNVIQSGSMLKLIDLGGVYRADDQTSPIYGTVGYQAPEIARTGPTVASDIYTVGRTIAVMCTDFRGFQSKYQHSLPTPDEVPAYQRFDSLYRLIERATATTPADRFQSAEEMADQIAGVLREVVAAETGKPAPGVSANFTPELRGALDEPNWRTLPVPLIDLDDPAATFLATLSGFEPDAVVDALLRAPESTTEVQLQLARAHLDGGRIGDATAVLDDIEATGSRDWRLWWYRGLTDLALGNPAVARPTFAAVYRLLPGDLAPKLALGVACELEGAPALALPWYETVARTDPWFLSASFALARCRIVVADDAPGAVSAYQRVPDTSAAYTDAQVARARVVLDHADSTAGVVEAASVVDHLSLDAARHDALVAEILERALPLIETSNGVANPSRVFGHELTEDGIRLGLESTYRSLARRAHGPEERIDLVDRANAIRPRTLT